MTNTSRLSAAAALLASFSLAATPATAADSPSFGQDRTFSVASAGPLQASDGDSYDNHRRWRGRNRVDAGDVIVGVAILGGIAAIASAANKNKRDRYDDRRYRNDYQRRYQSSNLDQAVSACTDAISRDVRVESVDSVARVGEGWQVAGRLYNGNAFTCDVSANGRIDRIDYAGNFSGAAADGEAYRSTEVTDDKQWSDDEYYEARQSQGGTYTATPVRGEPEQVAQVEVDPEQGPQPAYPGGPLPGEDYGDEIDGDIGG